MPTRPLAFQTRRHLLIGGLGVLAHGGFARAARPGHVVVVGAGLAGLWTALQLQRHGHRVQVLEAQARPGGRNWTLRCGDTVPDTAGDPQVCGFSEGQYFDAGPWRIMPWHPRMQALARCHRIALAPWNPSSPDEGCYAVGGMDAFVHHLAQSLQEPVATGCCVQNIALLQHRRRTRVEVCWKPQSASNRLHADAVVLALPLNRLHALQLPVPTALRTALQDMQAADAFKVGLEIALPIAGIDRAPMAPGLRMLWPPSGTEQRIVTLYGNIQAPGGWLQATPTQQIAQAHTQLQAALAAPLPAPRTAVAVQWSRIPHQGAAAARLPAAHASTYQKLRQGLPPIFFAGDALSPYNGWQEGALACAEHTAARVHQYLAQR